MAVSGARAAIHAPMLARDRLTDQSTANRGGRIVLSAAHPLFDASGQDVRGHRMEAPVVVEDPVDPELSQLRVLKTHAPDLDAQLTSGGTHDLHPPLQTTFGIGHPQRKQPGRARHRGTLPNSWIRLCFGANRCSCKDHTGRGQRDRGARQQAAASEQRQAPTPSHATQPSPAVGSRGTLSAVGEPAVGRLQEVALQLLENAHRPPANLARSVFSPRLTLWRTTACEQRSWPAISS